MSYLSDDFDIGLLRPLGSSDEPEAPGALRSVADTGVALAKGAVTGAKMLSDAFGAENPVSRVLGDARDSVASLESAYSQWEQRQIAADMKAAEGTGWLNEATAAVKGFARRPIDTTVEALGTSLPTLAAAFLPGGQGATLVRIGAMLGLGGAQGAGAVKSSIYEEVERAWKADGATDEEAAQRAQAAQEYFGDSAGQIALGTALGGAAGVLGAEAAALGRSILTRAGSKPAGLMARALGAGVSEALPEAAQGGQEAYAANKAVWREGFDVDPMAGVVGSATLEALGGFGVGAATGAVSRPSVIEAPPPRDDDEREAAQRDIMSATSVDEALDAFNRSVSGARDPDAALASIERQAQADAQALRVFGNVPGATTATPTAATPTAATVTPAAVALPSASVVGDMPFGDRVLTVREQLADPAVREAIRAQLGDATLREALYYATAADVTGDDAPPKVTRERMLGVAEAIVERVTLRRIEPAGAPARVGAAPAPALLQRNDLPRLPLDESPTGTVRVDAAGNARAETARESLMTRAQQRRAMDTGLTPDVMRAQRARSEHADAAGDETVARGTGADGVPVPAAPQGVGGVVPGQSAAAVPAAAPDRAGRGDGQGEGADARDAALTPQPGDLMTGDGKPYGTKSAATIRARKEGGTAVEVDGGWVVRLRGMADEQAAAGGDPVVWAGRAAFNARHARKAPPELSQGATDRRLAGWDAGAGTDGMRDAPAVARGKYDPLPEADVRRRLEAAGYTLKPLGRKPFIDASTKRRVEREAFDLAHPGDGKRGLAARNVTLDMAEDTVARHEKAAADAAAGRFATSLGDLIGGRRMTPEASAMSAQAPVDQGAAAAQARQSDDGQVDQGQRPDQEEAAGAAPARPEQGREAGEDRGAAPRGDGQEEAATPIDDGAPANVELRPDASGLPDGVRRSVADALGWLRENANRIAQNGPHARRSLLIDALPELVKRLDRLAMFREAAARQGYDAERVINRMGPEPDLAALVINAERVDSTVPGSRRLVMMCCGQDKLDHAAPARELYVGPMWQTLRTHQPRGLRNVTVMSAHYGLVHGDMRLDTYEQPMTPRRQAAVRAALEGQTKALADAFEAPVREVIVVGGVDYRNAQADAVLRMMNDGVIAHDANIIVVEGQIGEQRSKLGELLRAMSAGVAPSPDARQIGVLAEQTTDDLAAKTEREARADEPDQRQQVDREADPPGPEAQSADTREDTAGDTSGGPTADDARRANDQRLADRATDGSGDPFSAPVDDPTPEPSTMFEGSAVEPGDRPAERRRQADEQRARQAAAERTRLAKERGELARRASVLRSLLDCLRA